MQTNYISLALAYIFVFSLTLDARISLGLNFLYSEIVAVALLVSVLFRKRISRAPIYILAAFFFLLVSVSATLFVTDNQRTTFSSARNIISLLIVLLAFAMAGFSQSSKIRVLKAFSYAGIMMAVLGIHQALAGFDQSITVFSLGLVGAAGEGTSFALNWKLNNLVSSGLVTFQKALAIGLHQYSNNFAEFLIYVQIALLTVFATRSISKITFAIYYIILIAAVIMTQSRTCQIAFVIITVAQVLWLTRSLANRLSIIIAIAMVSLFALPMAISAFQYDGLGTVSGRQELNDGAVDAIGTSILTMLIGGKTQQFYAVFAQDPHSMFLFLALQFGIPLALLSLLFFVYIVYLMWSPSRTDTIEDRALRRGGLLASLWLLSYGLTWSVISVGAAGMTWALLIGIALPQRRHKARVRLLQARNDLASVS